MLNSSEYCHSSSCMNFIESSTIQDDDDDDDDSIHHEHLGAASKTDVSPNTPRADEAGM
jgi:hypothetical protein